jgi:hypothetical protein
MSHRPPIIVIGMHRSGTSLLTRTLQNFGLFMGQVYGTRNEEADFTKNVNDWLLAQAGSTWFTPEHMDDLLMDPVVSPLLSDYVRRMTNGLPAWQFLGIKRYLRYRSLHHVSEPWGWKDPRNTFTLPIWLSVFPNAKVLHIKRHGVDVAQSLYVRRNEAVNRLQLKYARQRWWYVNNPIAPVRHRFGHEPSCSTLRKAFGLWTVYMERARQHINMLGKQGLEIGYEELLGDPEKHLSTIVEYCGLDAGRADLKEAAMRFDVSRVYAYRDDPELAKFSSSVSEHLAHFGYSA